MILRIDRLAIELPAVNTPSAPVMGCSAVWPFWVISSVTAVSAVQRRRVMRISACKVWFSESRPVGSKEKSARFSVCSRCFADRSVI